MFRNWICLICICLLLAGCGREEPAPVTVPETTEPETTVFVCDHIWENGVCTRCGEACVHSWEAGKCSVCQLECLHESHSSRTLACTLCGMELAHDFQEGSCTLCSLERKTTQKTLPDSYQEPCTQQGTVEKLTYSTFAYGLERLAGEPEGSIPVEKYAYVYLPYGYDPETPYNVLYLLHGTGGGPETWFGIEKPGSQLAHTASMVDHLIASGEINPVILVSATYYGYVPEDSPFIHLSKTEPLDKLAPSTFALELPALVEAVESRYATFAHGDTSRENLRATRAHRAFAGSSQGAVTVLQSVVAKHLDIVGYLGNLSGFWTSVSTVVKYIRNYPEEEILFWYHGEGEQDIAHSDHCYGYRELLKQIPDRLTEGENILMVDKPGFEHTSANWYLDLYNMLHLFFL